jgi:hypothetical protein
VLRIFISIKNPSPWLGFEPATFGSSGKHTNYYTNKVTALTFNLFFNRGIAVPLQAMVAHGGSEILTD